MKVYFFGLLPIILVHIAFNSLQNGNGALREEIRLSTSSQVTKEEVTKVEYSTGGCPYKQGPHIMTRPINSKDGAQFDSFVSNLMKNRDNLLRKVTFNGDTTQHYHVALRDLHLMMRENYKKMTVGVGNNIFPLIVASDLSDIPGMPSGTGTTLTLYLADGSSKRVSPTPPEYEMLKHISHIPLGIYVMVSPYFSAPLSEGWIGPIKGFHGKVREALRAAQSGQVKIEETLVSKGIQALKTTDKHIQSWLKQGFVSVPNFEEFSAEMLPIIEKAVQRAASLQAQSLLPVLQQWKEELGDAWADTYFIVPTVWPVSAINPRYQVIAELVSPDQARTHIIMVENQGSIQDQRATLGRIVGDRAAALLIFGTETEARKEFVYGLSSRQDLLSNACANAISEYIKPKSGRPRSMKRYEN